MSQEFRTAWVLSVQVVFHFAENITTYCILLGFLADP